LSDSLDESRERAWLLVALPFPPTLVVNGQSATVDLLHSIDLPWNVTGMAVRARRELSSKVRSGRPTAF
jgi:hypothetical protein